MHTIRLRGPWSFDPLERFDLPSHIDAPHQPLPEGGDVSLPDDWRTCIGENFAGVVRFRRWFNLPTGLTPEHQVLLVIDQVDGRAIVRLTGEHLGIIEPGSGQFAAAVQDRLQPRNELTIDVAWPVLDPQSPDGFDTAQLQSPRGLTGLVWLAIFEAGETITFPLVRQ